MGTVKRHMQLNKFNKQRSRNSRKIKTKPMMKQRLKITNSNVCNTTQDNIGMGKRIKLTLIFSLDSSNQQKEKGKTNTRN